MGADQLDTGINRKEDAQEKTIKETKKSLWEFAKTWFAGESPEPKKQPQAEQKPDPHTEYFTPGSQWPKMWKDLVTQLSGNKDKKEIIEHKDLIYMYLRKRQKEYAKKVRGPILNGDELTDKITYSGGKFIVNDHRRDRGFLTINPPFAGFSFTLKEAKTWRDAELPEGSNPRNETQYEKYKRWLGDGVL